MRKLCMATSHFSIPKLEERVEMQRFPGAVEGCAGVLGILQHWAGRPPFLLL